MKTKSALSSLLVAMLMSPLAVLQAADARMFEGVNLDELKQTQRLQEMPEIYERDPATRRFRLLKPVMQIPLGEAWLSFNSELRASYLNKVPGENAAAYFGPIAGDAFETFKLEERFLATLCKTGAPEMDVEYRLSLMVRTGDAKLRERALRIMTAALATNVAVRTRAYHVAKFQELAANLQGDDVTPLRAAIAETEQRIDESRPTLADSAYQPGNDELARQGKLADGMQPGVAVPDAAWGEALDGLRASAVFATTKPKLGQEVSVWLLVENLSQKQIRFGFHDLMQDAHAKITRPDGTEVKVKTSWYTGLSPIQRHKLQPGERLTVAKKSLFFDEKESTNGAGFASGRVADGPGEFRVRYEFMLSTPAKGEWTGRLTTAETKIVIAGKVTAAIAEPTPAAPAAEAPAKPVNSGTKSILVNVMDSAGKKPIPEFRVIAGVKSSASGERDKEIVNWQPHTLRLGQDGALNWPLAKAYDQMALRVEADGYAPQVFAWLEKNKAHDVDFQLIEDQGTAGRVLTPDGKPAAGATVALAMVQREAVIDHGMLRHAEDALLEKESDLWRRPRIVKADADGRFVLPPENDPTAAVLIVHESGVREMALPEFKKAPDVTLQSWGRIEGQARWGDTPGTNRNVSLSVHRNTYGYPGVIAQYEKTITGADGSFIFERVLPGLVQLSCPMPATSGIKSGVSEVNFSGMTSHLTVQSGKNSASLGGQGRTVMGRLNGRESWKDVMFRFHPTAPHFGREGDTAMWAAWSAWKKSSIGPVFFRDGLKANADGTFEIPGVLPGNYQIFFTRAGEKAHLATGQFVVPTETPGTKPEPHSIGELRCR